MKARIQKLALPPELTPLLVLARVRLGLQGRPEVDASVLAVVEADLEQPVPPEVLAYYVSTGRDLNDLVRLTDLARRAGLDDRYLAFAPDAAGFWCVRAGRPAVPCMVGRWSPADDGPPEEDCSLGRFVRRAEGLEGEPTEDERAEVLAELKGFRVVVRPPKPGRARVVFHPKFGEGVVLREVRDGNHKLEIQFPSGVKTILARFVTDAMTAQVA